MGIYFSPQIYDLLGAAQTVDAHQGALSYLKLDYDDYLDFNERYFWALSFGSHPDPKIIKGTYIFFMEFLIYR